MSTIEFIQRHQISTFFAMAITYSWIWWTGLYILAPKGLQGGLTGFSVFLGLYALLGAQGSGVSGVLLTYVVSGKNGVAELMSRLQRWRVGLWWGAAILTAPLLLLVTLLGMDVIVSPTFLPNIPTGQNGVGLIGIGAVIGLIAGFIEEFGWTGFALPRLLARHNAFVAALGLGTFWSAWHIYPSIWGMTPSINALSFLGLAFGITGFATIPAYRILMSLVYINGKGSLLVAIIMHAFYDASIAVFVPSLTVIETVEFYAAFAIALWATVAVVVLRFGTSLTRPKASSSSPPKAGKVILFSKID